MNLDWQIWALALFFVFACLATLLWFFTRPIPRLPEFPKSPLPLEPIHLRFDSSSSFQQQSRVFADQSKQWQESMRRSGKCLKDQGVAEIVLLHGTFVGSDPVNVFSSLRAVFPRLSQKIESGMGKRMRGIIDHVAQDNGNFIPAYADLLEQALGSKIHVGLFYWSSSNHHLGRLEGAIGLMQRIAERGALKTSQRTLFIGHSHARQVFALFTHFLNSAGDPKATGAELWKFLESQGLASEDLQEKIVAIKKTNPKFDFVTLGGPIRYKWCFIPDMKVLHIVNHQGENSSITNVWSFWNTTRGDYVQQWGTMGSDNIAPTPRERTLNRELDEILGKGWHVRLWFQSIFKRERLGDFGRTLLVDYFHSSKNRSNFIKTVFGHGVYTRFDVMQFQFELICKYMYGAK